MGITTTSSKQSVVRCGVCGGLARGGVLVGAEGKGECCASKRDAALLASMIGDAPAPVEAVHGGELTVAYALGFADASRHRATLMPSPRPHVPLVDEYLSGVEEPEQAPVVALSRFGLPLLAPSVPVGDEAGQPIRAKSGEPRQGGLAEIPGWSGGRPVSKPRR